MISLIIISALHGSAPPARADAAATPYYLALGTSLTVGFQPNAAETLGYVGRVWRTMSRELDGLELRNLGCPGETSRSMIDGDGSLCGYAAGSQLDAAVAFLEAHPCEVAFITIEVGANDLVERCLARSGLIDRACAEDLKPRLRARLERILDALSTAAPGVPIVGMSYYNPFLGLWVVPGGRPIARADQRAWVVMNGALTEGYAEAGADVADVAAIFRIDDFEHTVLFPPFGRIPVNVARACAWTWFCSASDFGDPHPNRDGYEKIARTFERAVGRLTL